MEGRIDPPMSAKGDSGTSEQRKEDIKFHEDKYMEMNYKEIITWIIVWDSVLLQNSYTKSGIAATQGER